MSLRKLLMVGLISILLSSGFIIGGLLIPTAAQAQSLTIVPAADAYVNSASPSTNYGTGTTLRVDSSPTVDGYLRFNVSGLSGQTVSRAVLEVYANSATTGDLTAKSVATNTWTETAITYSNAPVMGGTLASAPSVTAGAWVTLDVTRYVTKNGTYTLGLTTAGSTALSLASRESGANSPRLVLTLSGSVILTPTKQPTPVGTSTPPPTGGSGNILLLAGDICKHNLGTADFTGNCKKTGDLVRSILAANPGAMVQTLGDNVNNDPSGSYNAQYTALYAPNWGSFLNVTHSVEGNHDTYPPGGTTPYFAYFGAAAGPKPGGYYSYNIGSSWHIIVLNAECSGAGGCAAGNPQTIWLQKDLAANTRPCVLAAWHQPRWTSGRHPDNSTYAAWWNLLYQYKADIVANGHNHNYERFNLINPNEQAAPDGIREFIAGTGGAPGDAYTYASHPLDPNEVIRNQTVVYGVLKLTLNSNSYSWNFVPATGYTFTDSGTTACH